MAAGLSLGEYSALHAAGVFDAATGHLPGGLPGKAMEEAAAGPESAMIAVLGLDREALQACDEAADLGCVVIANYNCPGQLVIGGEKAAVEKAAALAKGEGRQAVPAPEGQRPLPHLPDGPAGEALEEPVPECHLRAPDPRDLQLPGRP